MPIAILPFEAAHFSAVRAWFESLEEVVLWGGSDLRYPLEDVQLAGMLAETAGTPPARRCWSAFSDGDLIGHAQIAYDWPNGVGRLGRVALAPRARGKGLAAAMLRRLIEETFADPAIERLELYVYGHNEPAIGLYRSLGFVPEGNRRSAVKVRDSRWDNLVMGLLRHEAGFTSETKAERGPQPG